MTEYYKLGDSLKAERIAVQARDIDKVRVGKGTHDHKIQSTTLRDSAFCVIEVPLKAVLERRQ
jgi:hypothetical protein